MARYINGIKVSHRVVDLTGQKFSRLFVVELIGRHQTRVHSPLLWNCLCDCGQSVDIVGGDILSGHVTSCGCYFLERCKNNCNAKPNVKHGMSGTREHNAWRSMKSRCLNKNSRDYEFYSKIGIDTAIAEDFNKFLEAIGNIPHGMSGVVSVDRIDNTKGYIVGNLRWATTTQQARNKGKFKSNTSGVTGVNSVIYKSGSKYWRAFWRDSNKQHRSKSFGVAKYGEELARFLAEEYREHQITLLNLAGAGYTENHGK